MDQDVVIHLVAIIPLLSETCPDWSHAINVGGTRNVITAIQSLAQPPKLIYASSVALFGRDQDRPPPCTVADPIQPTDHYTSHKAECEQMVQAFGLQWRPCATFVSNGLRSGSRGDAPVIQRYADEIGANGYAPDAATAVNVVKGFLQS